jgi:hypothetical protein
MDATVLLGVAWPRAGADYLDLTYTINYTGTAPKGAKLRVTGHAASPGFLGLTVPVNYDQEFDISGLTAAQARNLILNSKANPIGLTPFGSDAAVNAAGTGIDITTLDDARGNARTVDRIDLTPNKAAKGLAANGAISIAAVQSRNDNSLGTASNGWTVALGAGIDSGGATGGSLLFTMNGMPVSAPITNGEGPEDAITSLANALTTDGFSIAPPQIDAVNHTGMLTVDFSNPTNFSLVGRPSIFDAELGLTDGASNLDFTLGFASVPEPATAVLLGAGAGTLLAALRHARRKRAVT